MIWIVTLTGAIMLIMGLMVLVLPSTVRPWIAFWKEGSRLSLAEILRLTIGVVFFMSASQTNSPLFIKVMGIAIFLTGVSAFMMGHERLHQMIDWAGTRSNTFLRVWALVPTVLGAAILRATL